MNIKTLSVGLVTLIIGVTIGVAALQGVSAATTGGVSNLVQNLAKKFNTSTSDVRSVFDETRTQNEEARQEAIKTSLDQAVQDGKITQDQEKTILDKLSNIKKQIDEARSAHEDLRNWAQSNNVDLQGLLPPGDFGHHGPGF